MPPGSVTGPGSWGHPAWLRQMLSFTSWVWGRPQSPRRGVRRLEGISIYSLFTGFRGRRGGHRCLPTTCVGVGRGFLTKTRPVMPFVALHGSLLPSTIFWPRSQLIPPKAPHAPSSLQTRTSRQTPPAGPLVSNSPGWKQALSCSLCVLAPGLRPQ